MKGDEKERKKRKKRKKKRERRVRCFSVTWLRGDEGSCKGQLGGV